MAEPNYFHRDHYNYTGQLLMCCSDPRRARAAMLAVGYTAEEAERFISMAKQDGKPPADPAAANYDGPNPFLASSLNYTMQHYLEKHAPALAENLKAKASRVIKI